MFFKYFLFELKILFQNRKQWILGLFILLFFPLFFQYYANTEPETLDSQKYEEKAMHNAILDVFPDDERDTSEGVEIYDILAKQLSLVNFQIYYLTTVPGKKNDNYVEDGLLLNDLRLKMHEKGNPHIPDYLIIPREELEKEYAFLSYLHERDMSVENDPYVTSHFVVEAIQIVSGILLYLLILMIGSDMFVYENFHQTVLKGLPISFMQKASSKIGLHYFFIMTLLIIGFGLGMYRSFQVSGLGNLAYPIVIYTKNGFKSISTTHYLGYALLAVVIIVCLVLCLTLLLNVVFKHMYTTVLVGIGIFMLPDVLHLAGIQANILLPLKYIDFTAVLSGEIAEQFGKDYIDYWHSMTWLTIFTVILIVVIIIQNRLSYVRKAK